MRPFVFFDVRTSDVDGTKQFFAELLGWESDGPLLTEGGAPWGGLTELAPDDGAAAEEVDELVELLEQAVTAARPATASTATPRDAEILGIWDSPLDGTVTQHGSACAGPPGRQAWKGRRTGSG